VQKGFRMNGGYEGQKEWTVKNRAIRLTPYRFVLFASSLCTLHY